jgi:hypothetical protein
MVVVVTLIRAPCGGNNRGCLLAVGILVGGFLRCDAGCTGSDINVKERQESYRQ